MTAPAFRVAVLPSMAAAEQTWRDLAACSTHPAFLDFDWVDAWAATVGAGLDVHIVVVSSAEGAPWMIWPFATRRAGPVVTLTWLAGDLADYQGPLVADDTPAALRDGAGFDVVWERILDALPRVDHVELGRLLPTLGVHDNPLRRLPHQPAVSAAHATRLGTDWQAWYQAKAAAKTRATHRRKARKLAALGPVTIEGVGPGPDVAPTLDAVFEMKGAGWRALGVADLFAEPAWRAFVTELTRRRPDLVHLSRLRIGERIVAVHWGLVHQGRFYLLLPAYDRGEIAKHSPGEQLLLWLMEQATADGLHTFDFTLGEDAYKARWADIETPLFTVHVARSRRGRLVAQGQQLATELKGRVKANPELYARALGLRARLFGGKAS